MYTSLLLTKMHNVVKMNEDGRYLRRYLIGGRSVGERERVKTIAKKGYFESADELLSLINNLSLFLYRKIILYKKKVSC